MTRQPQPALLIRARNNADAFAELYDAYGSRILRFLMRRVPDAELAFDMHQELFALAWERRHQFRGATIEEELGWLYAIARNLVAAFINHGKVERAAMGRLRLERIDLDDRDIHRVTDLAALQTLRPIIRDALDQLPPDQRQAIAKRVLQEQSYSEIAETLGVSHDVVRSRVSRGLRSVALALQESQPEITGELP